MEIKIELTEKEIAERKRQWIDEQLAKYMDLSYWEKEATKESFLKEIRYKMEYGANLYLTPEFKKELQNTLKEEVGKLVDEEIKKNKSMLTQIVSEFLFEKLNTLVQETLKNSIFVTTQDSIAENY